MKEMMKFFMRILISGLFPGWCLYFYLNHDLDGDYSKAQLLWSSLITIIVAISVFMYVPVAKKIERGSLIWRLGLGFTIVLAVIGLGRWFFEFFIVLHLPEDLMTSDVGISEWGASLLMIAIYIPVIHSTAANWDIGHKWSSLLKRATPVEDVSG